jgi:5-methylthioadenosine/S-adenosylhomocysteine deaminase
VLAGLLMPGLINVHGHAPMTLFRGAAEDISFERWLREVLWPREALLTPDDVYWGMTLACAEMLRAGVTTSCEMYIFEQAMLEAAVAAGSRCLLTPGVIEVPAWEHFRSWEERLEDVLAFHDQNAGAHDRIEIGIAPHSAYALPPEALAACALAARERNALFNVHVAESSGEGAHLERQHGMSVPFLLEVLGCLEGRVLAAHCVWLTEHDLRLFGANGVAIAHCPQSNAKLANGIAPLVEMLELGIPVGLGTDGPASNNNLDMWEEVRLTPLLARLRTNNASAISAVEALSLATRGGARALARDDIGSLEPGRWADMVLMRLDDPAFVPLITDGDLVTHLIWAASSRLVNDVWVAGQRVVRDGECLTVDEEQARAELNSRARRLAKGAA